MFVKTTDFYGFEKTIKDENERYGYIIALNIPAADPIYFGDTEAEVVEEIIRRKGEVVDKFGTIILSVPHSDERPYSAYYSFKKGEKRPPWFSSKEYRKKRGNRTYISLTPIQYEYGCYLTEQIKNGNLKAEDVMQKRPGRKTFWHYYMKYRLYKKTPEEAFYFMENLLVKKGETTVNEYIIKNGLSVPLVE